YRVDPLPWGADAPAYCRIARTFVATGSLELPPPDRLERDPQLHPETAWGTPYALTVSNRVYPKHSLLFALLLAPGYALGRAAGGSRPTRPNSEATSWRACASSSSTGAVGSSSPRRRSSSAASATRCGRRAAANGSSRRSARRSPISSSRRTAS